MINLNLKNTLNVNVLKKFFPRGNFINLNKKFFGDAEYTIPKFKINLGSDYELAKRQVFWRIRNIGQLELEFLLMKWYEQQQMNMEQLEQFTKEVLEMENPEMNKYFVKFDAPPEDFHYTKKIQYDIMNNLYR